MRYLSELAQDYAIAQEHGFSQWGKKDSQTFVKGNKWVWYVRDGWQTADLLDSRYQNHKLYPWIDGDSTITLTAVMEALENESSA